MLDVCEGQASRAFFLTVAPTDYRGFRVFWGGVTGCVSRAAPRAGRRRYFAFVLLRGHFLEAAELAENHHIG
jgi:hypothetical protein